MYGEAIASNKKLIHKLLTDFHEFYNSSTLSKSKLPIFSEYVSIPIDLIQFISSLILKSTASSDKINLFTTQNQEVIELIQHLVSELYKYQNKNIQIEHIFKYKNIKEQSDMTNNLTFLNDITSLIASYENYKPYFYTVSYTQEDSYTIYPNIILICDTLIYISEDFNTWFYIDGQKEKNIDKIISSYYNEFEKSKIHTKPFIRTMKDMASFQEIIINIENTSMVEHEFRRDMPCLSMPSNMSIDWFEYDRNVINEDRLKELIELHNHRTSNLKKRFDEGFEISVVCSKKSISDFLDKGRIYDQGEYPSFNTHSRIKIILNLINQLNTITSFSVHFIKEDMINYFPFIDKIQFCTNDNNILLSITDENSEICKRQPFLFSVLLDCPEISTCFNDYINTIIETMTYSKEESILIIKQDLEIFALKNNIEIPK